MTFDSLFEQVDTAIWEYADECNIDLSDSEECQSFGFQIPQYGDIQPKPSEFEIVNNGSTLGIYDNTNTGLGNILHINGGTGATAGNIGMGTITPSAPLEVASTTGGVVLPRMNDSQRDLISSPTNGEMIYNTTTNKFQGRANGAWVDFH